MQVGHTALSMAVINGSTQITEYLLEYGADASIATKVNILVYICSVDCLKFDVSLLQCNFCNHSGYVYTSLYGFK